MDELTDAEFKEALYRALKLWYSFKRGLSRERADVRAANLRAKRMVWDRESQTFVNLQTQPGFVKLTRANHVIRTQADLARHLELIEEEKHPARDKLLAIATAAVELYNRERTRVEVKHTVESAVQLALNLSRKS